jgi:CDP-paratose 2-epimerase
MKALITGGCGFLGSNIAAKFLSLGAEVIVVDALFRKGSELNRCWLEQQAKPKQMTFYTADTADADAVEKIFARHKSLNYVAHLAGQVAMTTSLEDPRRDLMTNVLGAFNVLEGCRRHSLDAVVVFSSTNKVYGDLKHLRYIEEPLRYTVPDYPRGFDESLPLDFASPYGCSKGAADQYFRDWHRNFGLKTIVFRHSSIYGGRQFATFDQGWIGWFCEQAVAQKKAWDAGQKPETFTISGTGKQVRDVLHARDLIDLYLAAYEKRDAAAGEIFNIGGGMENSLSLLELFLLLRELLKMPEELKIKKLPRRQSDQDFFVADISKASKLLGFKPKVDKKTGIALMLDWVRQNK